jgi:hypothetical protein
VPSFLAPKDWTFERPRLAMQQNQRLWASRPGLPRSACGSTASICFRSQLRQAEWLLSHVGAGCMGVPRAIGASSRFSWSLSVLTSPEIVAPGEGGGGHVPGYPQVQPRQLHGGGCPPGRERHRPSAQAIARVQGYYVFDAGDGVGGSVSHH